MGRDVLGGFPHDGWVRTEFLMGMMATAGAPGSRLAAITPVSSACVAAACNEIGARFLQSGYDWLWTVDTDMAVSDQTLPALLAWADPGTAPVVSAVCRRLGPDPEGILAVYEAGRNEAGQLGLAPLPSLPADGLLRVDAVGGACLLIHRAALEKLPGPELAWANLTVDGRMFGEDLSFCLRLADEGIPVHVACGVRVAHMKTVQLGDITP